MSEHAQLRLDLPVPSASGAEDFRVTDSNRTARAWIERWREWPGGVLALHGPAGSGKTHLLRIFLSESGGVPVEPDLLRGEAAAGRVGAAPAVALDDAERMLGDAEGEAALLHLLNWSRERATPLLLAAETPPARWPVTLPSLASRLRALPVAGIDPPDDALMCAVFVKLFADRGLLVDQDVPLWLTAHIDRSLAAVRETVALIDAAALDTGRKVSVRFLRGLFPRDRGQNRPTEPE